MSLCRMPKLPHTEHSPAVDQSRHDAVLQSKEQGAAHFPIGAQHLGSGGRIQNRGGQSEAAGRCSSK
jgi:hypothetical protein